MKKKSFEALDLEQLDGIRGGADEDGGGAGMDFMGGGGEESAAFMGSSGLDLGRPTGETVPVSDGRSDYAPAPVYEQNGSQFVSKSDFPSGTQFWENSPPAQSNGVLDWIKPGGGYDQATRVMQTFNSLFRGWGANSPMTKTGYKPF